MKTNFNFQLNNWELNLILDVKCQEIVNDVVDVTISIMGCNFENRLGILNLETRKLICKEKFSIKPYKENEEIKSTYNFIVPKDIVKQIKSYLN